VTLLAVENLAKQYGGIAALTGASFAIERPGIYGLIGPNGAGKTTLFDVITGTVAPDTGRVLLGGRDVTGLPAHALWTRGVARTFQECRLLPEFTCMENLLFAVQRKDMGWTLRQIFTRRGAPQTARDEAMRLLQLVGMEHYAEERAADLSFGQRRLLDMVATFITRPRVLLLDEPASGVNPSLLATLSGFIRRMYEESPSVFLVVEHNMEFIMALAGDIIVMHQGAVLERGAPDAVSASERVIEAYLG
jgi:ABC-type branched-subunit amino acid transport system ATPase component